MTTSDIQTRRRKKIRFFHILIFYFLNTEYYPINYIIELAQLQNKLHVPVKDKLDIFGQFRVMPRTNLLHTHTHIFQKPCILILNTLESNYNMFLQQFQKLLSHISSRRKQNSSR